MDELNHDFQALALEGRAMGEVSERHTEKILCFGGGEGENKSFFEAAGMILNLKVLHCGCEGCVCVL